jgi:hypothetical protein
LQSSADKSAKIDSAMNYIAVDIPIGDRSHVQ